ncbi:MAG: acyltransferase [Promethearchaeota archaeon]|jgi:acetyltransferase-like isoleucine patch superfamily enzyme
MSEEVDESGSPSADNPENHILKEEVKLQFYLYIIIFFFIFYSSWVIPGLFFFWYLVQVFLPQVLEISNFIVLFTEIDSLIAFISMPIILIGCYVLHLLLLGITSKMCWKISEKKSPSKSGVIPRNIRSRAANYYHIRSFLIKYGKNSFTKGVLPWLSNWFFNSVGSNKIGKGTTLEESVGMDKFIDVGENCYFGVNSTLASHLIQGIFGNITYFKINVGNNITAAAMCQIGPGSEIHDNSFLLPLASTNKHSVLKGNNYYWGIPLRKIFRKKTMEYLELSPKDLEINENIAGYTDKKLLKKLKAEESSEKLTNGTVEIEKINNDLDEIKIDINSLKKEDLAIDFTTSSAISRVNSKFLAVYLPIFWLAGLIISILWYWYLFDRNWIYILSFLPVILIGSIYLFILAVIIFSKLLLILVNLIHKPKEGIFRAEIGDTDFEFWALRTELKKIALWFMRNSPLPWTDVFALKIFGVDMDASSHLNDAWCDAEFIKFGRKNLIGQGATIMSSMVVGKYLIIKKVVCDDYIMIGGHTTIAPGTIMGKESVIGALSSTTVNQVLEPNWVYFGIPAIKLKQNKYAEERREVILKRDVDESQKFEIEHEINIDKDKKSLVNKEKEVKET